ncbi:MAG: ABC transporter permease, partial [Paracoccus sp. (in: a-proteobacteria)]|nr:ABC transporter permease [Paracoccus sp. (in: a-proteobacteria)]
MLRYLIRRLISLGLSLLVASALIFSVVALVPGDPASFMLGTGAQPDTVAALRAQLGLDQPWPVRYANWLGAVLTGDLGQSFTYKTPVAGLIADRVQVSLPLALMSLALAVVIAFPAGMFAAARRGRAGDAAVMGATQVGIALPNFWFAMLLVLLFAVNLRWLPAGGFPGWDRPVAALQSLILPAVALALPQAAILARVLR